MHDNRAPTIKFLQKRPPGIYRRPVRNRVEEAENARQEAIRIARSQDAKSYELRAAMNLARFWGEQGRRSEARQLLAPVYGWFTEGFDTADLREGKKLLDELA